MVDLLTVNHELRSLDFTFQISSVLGVDFRDMETYLDIFKSRLFFAVTHCRVSPSSEALSGSSA